MFTSTYVFQSYYYDSVIKYKVFNWVKNFNAELFGKKLIKNIL
jgi:hypothetical protein